MINKFDEIKEQLRELSDTVNSFKSEAVQLRIIDHLLGKAEEAEPQGEDDLTPPPSSGKVKRKRTSKPASANTSKHPSTKKRMSSGDGAVATLNKLYGDGFFSQKRTIGDIINHCDINLARKFKANDISGRLGRMVRSEELKRSKNDSSQYEYTNA